MKFKFCCSGWWRMGGQALVGLVLVAGQSGVWAQAQVAVGAASSSQAANSSVIVQLDQFKVLVGPDGKESLGDAKTVKPGDIVEYRATYMNRDSRPVSGLQATLPVPEGMVYLAKSARPGNGKAMAATLDGRYAPEPLTRQVRVNGNLRTEAVPYGQYRFLRWDLGQLAAGTEQVVTARMQVEPLPVSAKAEAGKLAIDKK